VHPVDGTPIGTLVYYHGGEYVIGDIDSHQAHAIRFASRSRVVVLNSTIGWRPSTHSLKA
jgi:acetyl esterase